MTAGPRERLLTSAIDLVRRHGVAGTGLSELLEHSGTARGSVYQHFPGGKDELIAASTRAAGEFLGVRRDPSRPAPTPAAVVRAVVEGSQRGLVSSDFALGCPIVAAATAGPEHAGVVDAAGDVFRSWTGGLAETFVAGGMEPAAARAFAGLLVSAVEGALIQARATRSVKPFDDIADQLVRLAEAHLTGG